MLTVKKKCGVLMLIIFYVLFCFIPDSYADSNCYNGIPKINIFLNQIDESDGLIYAGIDAVLFWDDDKDGIFTVVPNDSVIKRIMTNSLNFSFDFGKNSEYKKGIRYRIAIRTLYYSVGCNPEIILISDFDNGHDGFVIIPESEFIPTYFASSNNEYIKHTKNWESNRKGYNRQKEEAGSNEKREYDVFWPGEKLEIEVETTEVVEKIKVSILVKSKKYETQISSYEDSLKITGGAIYKGCLWNKEMINKWGNYAAQPALINIAVVGKNGEILESKVAEIIFDNRQLYFRHHKTR